MGSSERQQYALVPTLELARRRENTLGIKHYSTRENVFIRVIEAVTGALTSCALLAL